MVQIRPLEARRPKWLCQISALPGLDYAHLAPPWEVIAVPMATPTELNDLLAEYNEAMAAGADYKPASIEVKLAAVEAENKRRDCLQTPLEALRDDSST